MTTSSFNADVGQTQFLQLLVSQLQYQDPLQPVEQQDFLSQLAQFSVLDGIEQMNLKFDDMIRLESLSQGADLVGQQVRYNSAITGETLTGKVDEARIINLHHRGRGLEGHTKRICTHL